MTAHTEINIVNSECASVELLYAPCKNLFAATASAMVRNGWSMFPRDVDHRLGSDQRTPDDLPKRANQATPAQLELNTGAHTLKTLQIPNPASKPVKRFGSPDSAALAVADAAAPHLRGLAMDWLPRMPRRPRASTNIRSHSLNRSSYSTPLAEAVEVPWIALDSATHRNVLIIDIDRPDALDRWLVLPEALRPTLVMDPWSGRAHAILPLAAPVLITGGARPKPKLMADLAGRLLAAALGGTLLPAGSLTKNPWGLTRHLVGTRRKLGTAPVYAEHWAHLNATGLMWTTLAGSGPYGLRDVVAAFADQWDETAPPPAAFRKRRQSRGEPDARGRNCALFDLTRWWAYDNAETDGGRILEQATLLNTFPYPLPASEVNSIARSIARFMFARFRPQRAETARGRDHDLTLGLCLPAAQAVAARETNKMRLDSTNARLAAAMETLRQGGERITQIKLAKASGLSLATVKRRWNGTGPDGNAGCHALSVSGNEGGAAALCDAGKTLRRSAQDHQVGLKAASVHDALTARMLQGRGSPLFVPFPPPGIADARVSEAWSRATHAFRIAQARDAARRVRLAAAERRAERIAWHTANGPLP